MIPVISRGHKSHCVSHFIPHQQSLKHSSKCNYSPIRYNKIFVCACMSVYANARVHRHTCTCVSMYVEAMNSLGFSLLSTVHLLKTESHWPRTGQVSWPETQESVCLPPQSWDRKSTAPHWVLCFILFGFWFCSCLCFK